MFIALPVDDLQDVRPLKEVFENLKKYESLIKIVTPDNYHITLKFFGSVDPALADSISKAFASIDKLKKVQYAIEGLGAFPSAAEPSVVWAGLKCDEEPLGKIFKAVEQFASSFGFPPEKRKFVPHLTLGRIKREKKASHEFKSYLIKEKNSLFTSSVFRELVLFESVLKNTGAEYKKIEVIKLV